MPPANALIWSSDRERFTDRQWTTLGVLAACAGLAVLAVSVAPYATALTEPYPHRRGSIVVLALLACGPIAVFRRGTLAVLAVVATATAVVMASGVASLPLGVTLGVAAFCAASRRPRRQSIPVTLLAGIGLSVALV
jgi:hypothetical protein